MERDGPETMVQGVVVLSYGLLVPDAREGDKMAVDHVHKAYRSITPYLMVENAAGLIDFLVRGFGAEELHRLTRPDGGMMHATIRIGDSLIMMSEPEGNMGAAPAFLYLYVEDADATYRRALEAGATGFMPPSDQFYGDRMGAVKDPAGNSWFIATHVEDVPPEEIARRAGTVMAKQGACASS